jgi:diaminopimelate decarboxylase
MNHFDYRPPPEALSGADAEALFCEDVPLADIAAAVGTPVYVYSTATLERHFQVFRDAFRGRKPLIAYAVKANPNLSIIAALARLGAGADTVSEGEIRRALVSPSTPASLRSMSSPSQSSTAWPPSPRRRARAP